MKKILALFLIPVLAMAVTTPKPNFTGTATDASNTNYTGTNTIGNGSSLAPTGTGTIEATHAINNRDAASTASVSGNFTLTLSTTGGVTNYGTFSSAAAPTITLAGIAAGARGAVQMTFSDATNVTFSAALRRNGSASASTGPYTFPAGTYLLAISVRYDGSTIDLSDNYIVAIDVPVSGAPSNYSPAAANVQKHLEAIDAKFGTLSSGGDNISVNGAAASDADFDDATPAAPAGGANVHWQKDTGSPNNVSAYIDMTDFADAFRRKPFYWADFVGSQSTVSTFDPFIAAAISSGTISTGIATASHPGVIKFTSSTTANSGYRCYLGTDSFLLGGGEAFTCIFYVDNLANLTLRLGFEDTTSSADVSDGAYIEIDSSGVATAKTASNSTRTSNATTYTLSAATWYRAKVVVNSDATSVSFTLYNDAGTSLWSVANTANIPTGAGRFTGCGIVATNSGTSATDLIELDYIAMRFVDRALTR